MSEATRVLLVTSNGAGMGHLTRMLSVALAGGASLEPHLFSLSIGLPQVMALGVTGEYCPSYGTDFVPGSEWHGYLRERIIAIANELDIQMIAFDGVAPYPGIGQARPRLPGAAFAWIRRGMWRPNTNVVQLKKTSFFDTIIEPGDLAADADKGATVDRDDAIRVAPITMLDVVPRLPRSEAAMRLGIDPDRPTALVTLGSGRLGDVEGPGAATLDALLRHDEWQICVTRPAVASKRVPVVDPSRIVELSGVYPLVAHLDAFDVAVSAAGYNAVHEFVPSGTPTLFVPNTSTRTDDQVARAASLAQQGLALVAQSDDAVALHEAVDRLVDPGVRAELISAIEALPASLRGGGAAATATLLAKHSGRLMSPRQTVAVWLRNADLTVRETIKRTIGPKAVEAIRRWRGTTGPPITNVRRRVAITKDAARSADVEPMPLLITDTVTTDMLRSNRPVEHMISSSTAYRRTRRKIINKYYEVLDGEHLML